MNIISIKSADSSLGSQLQYVTLYKYTDDNVSNAFLWLINLSTMHEALFRQIACYVCQDDC